MRLITICFRCRLSPSICAVHALPVKLQWSAAPIPPPAPQSPPNPSISRPKFAPSRPMERPPPRLLALLLLLSCSPRLGDSRNDEAATALLAIEDKVEFRSEGGGRGASGLKLNEGNAHTRKLLQPGHHPTLRSNHHSGKQGHRKARAPTSSPLHSPSGSLPPSLPPGNAPSPSALAPSLTSSPILANSPLVEPLVPRSEQGPRSNAPPPSKLASISNSTAEGTPTKHTTNRIKYLTIAVGVSFLLAVSAMSVVCFRAKKIVTVTVRPWTTGLSGQLQRAFVTGVPALKRSELEAACEDFSNIIGSLSDSMLYKGTLSSGVEIAVISSMISSSKDWTKHCETQFRKKTTSLSGVNHKNFMNLLGYCEEEQPFTRMMVFEYAPNGTLFEHLHVREADHLDWMARLRISMGVTYCLEHMHQLKTPVILQNLKSSTIYLTDDYAAKVSDLQLWNDATDTDAASESSGPLPDPKSVIYKFGILLLEILSGQLPFSEDDDLLENWALCYLNGEKPLQEMIDPTLKSFCEETLQALCKVIRSCIDPDPKKRPTMTEVASRMREITSMPPDGATPKVSPLWWAELEIISSEAS